MWTPDSEINSIGMTISHSVSTSSGEFFHWLRNSTHLSSLLRWSLPHRQSSHHRRPPIVTRSRRISCQRKIWFDIERKKSAHTTFLLLLLFHALKHNLSASILFLYFFFAGAMARVFSKFLCFSSSEKEKNPSHCLAGRQKHLSNLIKHEKCWKREERERTKVDTIIENSADDEGLLKFDEENFTDGWQIIFSGCSSCSFLLCVMHTCLA